MFGSIEHQVCGNLENQVFEHLENKMFLMNTNGNLDTCFQHRLFSVFGFPGHEQNKKTVGGNHFLGFFCLMTENLENLFSNMSLCFQVPENLNTPKTDPKQVFRKLNFQFVGGP